MATDTGEWHLVWNDEFAQSDGEGPNADHWGYTSGGGGFGNAELQTYTKSRENSCIEDGMLVIKAQKSAVYPRLSSARIFSYGEASWLYGRFEIRAKLPIGQGIWPAIWMLPTNLAYGNWPVSGEIDIMENLGHQPGKVHASLHYGNPHTFQTGSYDLPSGESFVDEFHIFALEWEPEEIRWYIDNELYQTRINWFSSAPSGDFPAPFDQPFHLIMNVAVGGTWPGNPDSTTDFPQMMYIDYVRVYQRDSR
jgi:beta-glucanase (GH16 family)